MAGKPTYEELQQKIREFELEAERHKAVDRTLDQQAQILSSIKDTIVIITPEMKTIYANQTAKDLFGDRPEMFTEPCYRFFKNRDTVCENCPVLKAIQDEKPNKAIMKSYDKNGQEMWRFNTAFPFYDRDGQVIAGIEMVTDYTPQKRAEIAVQASEERYRALFENMKDGVAIYEAKNEGEDFTFIDFNKAGERINNIRKEALIGKGVLEVFPAVKDFGLFDVFNRVWKTGKPEHHPISIYKDERIAGWRDNFVYKLASGEIVAIYSDETDRKRSEEALRESEEIFQQAFEGANDGICLVDTEGNLTKVNKRMSEIFGYSKEELESMTVNDIAHPEDVNISPEFIKRSIAKEVENSVFEKRYIHKQGRILWGQVSSSIVRDSKGDPLYFISHVQDITQRKRAEEALRESEKRFRHLFERAPLGYQSLDAEGCFLDVNQAWLDLLGYSRDQVIGSWFGDFLAPMEIDAFKERFRYFIATGEVHADVQMVQRSGSTILVHIDGSIGRDERGEFRQTHCILHDITARKRAEEELRASEDKYRSHFENVSDLIYSIDPELKVRTVSPSVEKILGYRPDEVIGLPFQELNILAPEYLTSAFFDVKSVLAGEKITFSVYEFIAKDGSRKIGEVSGSPLIKQGEIIGVISVARDITEKRKLEDRLQEASKMEAIATLAGGIAHQFNNALSSITGHTGLLEIEYPEDEKIMDYAKAMKQSAHRMAHLTSQLLAYARGGKYNPQTISLSNFVEGALPIIQHILDPDIRLETDLPQDVMNVEVDRTQMQMVLSAIVANASEAMEAPGRIRISTRNMDLDKEFIKDQPDFKPGPYVCLSIEDDGKGMDEETRKRIFEPFFTTHFIGRGLGMSAAYGIVTNHDGSMSVDSEPGKGTTVSIYLPALETREEVEEELKERIVSAPLIDLPAGEGTVLVIEDEEPLVKMFRKILERLGYRVLLARTGEEAVEMAKTFDGRIDLALLDIKLPDMSGNQIYPLIMEARPNLKVVVCSGYSIDGPAQEILDAGAQAFIQKPFFISTLAEKLKEVLGGK